MNPSPSRSLLAVTRASLAVAAFSLITGCIAIPPLINVQHDHHKTESTLDQRLQSIEQKLDRLEKRMDEQPQ